MAGRLADKYLREDMMPHIWCPGCGNGIIVHDLISAIDNMGLDPDKVMIVSGIGCSSRAAGYMNFNTIHTLHGRAIPVATGIKMARPDLHVIVITGDGDAVAIGGNHFIHAARRNIDLTVIVFNNSIYGMTGGQFSPTTPKGDTGTTAPYGTLDRDFDVCRLAVAAGATYVAMSTTYHVRQTTKLIEGGIAHRGFSVINCLSQCPTYYGRKNKRGDAASMMKWFRDNAQMTSPDKGDEWGSEWDRVLVGLLHEEVREEHGHEYFEMVNRLKEDAYGRS